jgi:HNH endonuclease.
MTPQEIIKGNKLIAEFESNGYKIFRNGIVIGKNNKPLKLHINKNGYFQAIVQINKKQKTYLLHRLLSLKFIYNTKNLPEVNHKDGNKINNNIKNLEWVNRSENIRHGFKTGLITPPWKGKFGYFHTKSKTVLQFKNGIKKREYGSTREAARINKMSSSAIQDACRGKLKTYKGFTWKYKK